MNGEHLQELIDAFRATSRQRFVLAAVAVTAAGAASTVTALRSAPTAAWVVACVAGLAVAAAARPARSHALGVMAIVVVQWIAVVDDPTTSRGPIVAACLFAFHATVALMAVTPYTAEVHPDVLRRWLLRSRPVVAATIGVWALVVLLDRRDADGNAVLTFLAFVALAAGILALRSLTLAETGAPGSDEPRP